MKMNECDFMRPVDAHSSSCQREKTTENAKKETRNIVGRIDSRCLR